MNWKLLFSTSSYNKFSVQISKQSLLYSIVVVPKSLIVIPKLPDIKYSLPNSSFSRLIMNTIFWSLILSLLLNINEWSKCSHNYVSYGNQQRVWTGNNTIEQNMGAFCYSHSLWDHVISACCHKKTCPMVNDNWMVTNLNKKW